MLYLIEIYSYYALFDRNILVVYGFRELLNANKYALTQEKVTIKLILEY